MRICVGSDHAGFRLKEEIKSWLANEHILHDFGCYSEESVDYADVAGVAAQAVARGEFERGILVCGTGIGMCIAANKVKGIRAALAHDVFSAKATRAHNDSNILTMGARVIGSGVAQEVVNAWLGGVFEGGRHVRRIEKITSLEEMK
jgi:ribose 5-phosphate isomerase B